jgi:hypothetical protein
MTGFPSTPETAPGGAFTGPAHPHADGDCIACGGSGLEQIDMTCFRCAGTGLEPPAWYLGSVERIGMPIVYRVSEF